MSKFGDLVRGKASPAPEPTPAPIPEPVVEVTERPDLGEDTTEYAEVIEEEVAETYESDVSLHDMDKKELEAYGRTVGIELDRRHSKKRLVQELQDYLANP